MRMQLTQVYVQKSTRTTLPRWDSKVNGSEFIQLAMPVISGTVGSSPVAGATTAWDAAAAGSGAGLDGMEVAVSAGAGVSAGAWVAGADVGAAAAAADCWLCVADAALSVVYCGAEPAHAVAISAAISAPESARAAAFLWSVLMFIPAPCSLSLIIIPFAI